MIKPLTALALAASLASCASPPTKEATVKITKQNGHGSGVHIGNGLVLTAAHVASVDDLTVSAQDGEEYEATILWTAGVADVALLKIDYDGLPSAMMDCAIQDSGTEITSWGNPMYLDFVSSTGVIAGEPRDVGQLKNVYVTDTTTIMGQSGGPVFANGRLVGITVGLSAATDLTTTDGIITAANALFSGVGTAFCSTLVGAFGMLWLWGLDQC